MSAFICFECKGALVELPTMRALMDHQLQVHSGQSPVVQEEDLREEPEAPPSRAPDPPRVPQGTPISLAYRYVGSCPQCGRDVDTIDISLPGEQLAVIAYCAPCKQQHQQQTVIPITSQYKTKKPLPTSSKRKAKEVEEV